MAASGRRSVLSLFQAQFESIHGVKVDGEIDDFLIGHETLVALGAESRVPEELVFMQSENEQDVEVGLYVSPQILTELAEPNPPLSLLLGRLLPSYCAAAEGVSHWLYVQHQAAQDRAFSRLELEVQAEVDKFASCVIGLWQLGLKSLCHTLRTRLFNRVGYFGHLSLDERARYQTANQLAWAYSGALEDRFVVPGDFEGLLRELRRSFRLGGGEKYAHLGRR
jgi:hypothetical protein